MTLGVALLNSGCGSSQPQLHIPGEDPPAQTNATMYEIATNVPETAGAGTYCVTLPGKVTITRVAFHNAVGDIRIDAFAVRPNPARTGGLLVGNTDVPLASIAGFDPTASQAVDSLCPTQAEFPTSTSEYELALQLTRLSGELAGAFAIDITYASGSATSTLTAPYGLWLCSRPQPVSGTSTFTLDSGQPPPC